MTPLNTCAAVDQVAAGVAKARLRRSAAPVPGCSVASPAMVDAPVSGGTTGASAATLSFMVRPGRPVVPYPTLPMCDPAGLMVDAPASGGITGASAAVCPSRHGCSYHAPKWNYTARVIFGRALSGDRGLCMASPACSASWPGVKAGTCAGECMHGPASLPTCKRCCKGLHWNACLMNWSATRELPCTYETKLKFVHLSSQWSTLLNTLRNQLLEQCSGERAAVAAAGHCLRLLSCAICTCQGTDTQDEVQSRCNPGCFAKFARLPSH